MAITENGRAAAAATFVAVVGAIVVGQQLATPSANKRSSTVAWEGAAPSNLECMTVAGLASPQARKTFGLDDSSGASEYVNVRVCYVPSAGGEKPELPGGMVAVDGTHESSTDKSSKLSIHLKGESGGFKAACSSGHPSCEWLKPNGMSASTWVPAPKGITMAPGTWRGTCVTKTPVELSGVTSMPSECR